MLIISRKKRLHLSPSDGLVIDRASSGLTNEAEKFLAWRQTIAFLVS